MTPLTKVTPTPFSADRAQEIWRNKSAAGRYSIEPGEDAYVKQAWELLDGESSWTSALLGIANGAIVPAADLRHGDVLAPGQTETGFRGGKVAEVRCNGNAARAGLVGRQTIELWLVARGATSTDHVRMQAGEPVLIEPRRPGPTALDRIWHGQREAPPEPYEFSAAAAAHDPAFTSGMDHRPYTVVGLYHTGVGAWESFVEHFEAANATHAADLLRQLHRDQDIGETRIVAVFAGHLHGELSL